MVRRASVLVSGIFAVSAALQGAAACNSDDGTAVGQDSGPPTEEAAAPVDSGPTIPVMTVTGPSGDQIAPDWSCYAPDASFLVRPRPLDIDGGDGADSDADASDDAAIDTGTGVDSALPPPDAAPPPHDASAPDAPTLADAGSDAGAYILIRSDFVSAAPPSARRSTSSGAGPPSTRSPTRGRSTTQGSSISPRLRAASSSSRTT